MYLQITTKCNFHCAHCCYSCGKWGKHMDFNIAAQAIHFISGYDNDCISIGGGEPTFHPRFFDILRMCLDNFDYVWMATNGSRTKSMFRLSDIIDGNEFENQECTCTENELDGGYCRCYEDAIQQDGKLTVALSLDQFHDPIDQRIEDLWRKKAKPRWEGCTHYEIRSVDQARGGIIAQGRAKKTGSGWSDGCVCSEFVIKPNGKIKLCGCNGAPTIGDVWNGIETKWSKVFCSGKFQETNCYQSLHRKAA
jgi:organic radical activating enzyme